MYQILSSLIFVSASEQWKPAPALHSISVDLCLGEESLGIVICEG